MERHAPAPGTFPHNGYITGVAPELADIVLHPLEPHDLERQSLLDATATIIEQISTHLVQQSDITGCSRFLTQIEEAVRPHPVLQGDKDNLTPLDKLPGFIDVQGGTASGEAPAKDPHEDRQVLK